MIHQVVPGVQMPSPWPISWEGTFDIQILEFLNPTNFTYTKPIKLEELGKFEEEMLFDIVGGHPYTGPTSNNYYAVMEGDSMCRGELLHIEDGEATLKLIDWGTTLVHPLHDLFKLPLKYDAIPPFCTKAYIGNIQPFHGDRWEMTCSTHYKQKLVNKTSRITIIRDHPTREGHEVELFITPYQINLGETLVKNQLAQYGEYNYCLLDDIQCASPAEIHYLLDGELPASFDPVATEISQREHLEFLDLELEQEKEVELMT